MAKADDASSTIDWFWLHDAYRQAVPCFGSDVLAEKRLREWLAAGELPWSCMLWEGPDADDIARLKREDSELIVKHILPSAAYHAGDPQFWQANPKIWWEKNGAREFSAFGARALGIKVSRKHLLALLPAEPGEHDEAHSAKAWVTAEIERMKKAKEIPPGIRIRKLSRDLEQRMRKAAASNKSLRWIKAKSIENGLREWGLWTGISSIR